MKKEQAQDDVEALEKEFLRKLEITQRLDSCFKQIQENYSNGMESLATLKFESPEAGNRISSIGYTIGPAFTTVENSGDKIKVIKNRANKMYYIEKAALEDEMGEDYFEDEDFGPIDDLNEFKKKMAQKPQHKPIEKELKPSKNKKEKELDEVDPDEIYSRFGVMSVPPKTHRIKNYFEKVLENAINIAELLRQIDTGKE